MRQAFSETRIQNVKHGGIILNDKIDAYPLHWPDGWPRTKLHLREHSKFKSTFAVAKDQLFEEVSRLRGKYFYGADPILSTNISLRLDGLPYANQSNPDDPGVAIYFVYKSQNYCFACDKYKTVWENMVAIRKTIEAIRGIERWGASDMMNRAFQGFVAIESKPKKTWFSIIGVSENATRDEVKSAYMRKRSDAHPDNGGSADLFNDVTAAWVEYSELSK